jgi:hypothetical protein
MKTITLPLLTLFGCLVWSGVPTTEARELTWSYAVADLPQRTEPRITGVTPSPPVKSAAPQTVTITGEGFATVSKIEVSMPDGSIKSFAGADLSGRTPTSVQVSLAFSGMGRYEFVAIASDGSTSSPFAVEVRGAETSVEGPVINRVQPAQAMASREPQVFQVEGRRFDAGLRAIVTDPAGTDVTAQVGKVTPTSFELSVTLSTAGDYSLVVNNPNGGVSSVVRIEVR